MIHYISDWQGTKYWAIGNMKDPVRINGWCYAEHIYVRLMEVSPVQLKPDLRLYQPILVA